MLRNAIDENTILTNLTQKYIMRVQGKTPTQKQADVSRQGMFPAAQGGSLPKQRMEDANEKQTKATREPAIKTL